MKLIRTLKQQYRDAYQQMDLFKRVCPENWVPKSGHITTIFLGRGVFGMMPVRNVVKNERVGKLEMRR